MLRCGTIPQPARTQHAAPATLADPLPTNCPPAAARPRAAVMLHGAQRDTLPACAACLPARNMVHSRWRRSVRPLSRAQPANPPARAAGAAAGKMKPPVAAATTSAERSAAADDDDVAHASAAVAAASAELERVQQLRARAMGQAVGCAPGPSAAAAAEGGDFSRTHASMAATRLLGDRLHARSVAGACTEVPVRPKCRGRSLSALFWVSGFGRLCLVYALLAEPLWPNRPR